MHPTIQRALVAVRRQPLITPADLDDAVLRHAIESARDGITISDARQPGMPIVYVNPAFERMTGYHASDILGLNCRFLQADDRLQAEVAKVRRAIHSGGACVVTLRNYRRNGKLFYNELSLSPVRDRDGQLTHYIGIQKDVSRRIRAEQRLRDRDRELQRLNIKLERLARCDSLTGLLNRRTFNDCLDREWRRALRDGGYLNLFMIDVDKFKSINDRHGHTVGDTCLRRVAGVLEECFGRASDFVARYGGEEFVVLNSGLEPAEAAGRGQVLLDAVRELKLPKGIGTLTISAGLCSVEPCAAHSSDALLRAADTALYAAKDSGRDRLEIAPTPL